MATTVIDELITILGFKVQSDDLKKLDRQLREVDRSVSRPWTGSRRAQRFSEPP